MTASLSVGSERRLLQAAVAVFAFIPIAAGLAGVLSGVAAFDDAAAVSPAWNSHSRYLSGLLLAIGLTYWSTIPAIETVGPRFRTLTVLVFIGGLGRLFGVFESGWPPLAMTGGLIMELLVTPSLALWRERIECKVFQSA